MATSERIFHTLFLCTGNSARSILAEGLLGKLGGPRFRAYSAGSRPTGTVHPYAARELWLMGIDPAPYRSKCWDEFAGPGAPAMDFVITVCDRAAGEVCPVWPGHPITAHWSFPDPAQVVGDDTTRYHAFSRVALEIQARIRLLVSLPLDTLDRLAVNAELRAIGATPQVPEAR